MICDFMRFAALQFEAKLQKCIRMGIIIFKLFIGGGGISSDIRSNIVFYGKTKFPTVYPMIYLPKFEFRRELFLKKQ